MKSKPELKTALSLSHKIQRMMSGHYSIEAKVSLFSNLVLIWRGDLARHPEKRDYIRENFEKQIQRLRVEIFGDL